MISKYYSLFLFSSTGGTDKAPFFLMLSSFTAKPVAADGLVVVATDNVLFVPVD